MHYNERKPATNTGLAKVAVQCSADTFVVNQTLVLRINICGKNRHLRQARKRYVKLLEINAPNKLNLETNIFHFEFSKLDIYNSNFKIHYKI